MEFAARYGPWALVTGASAGLGEQFAHALARRGLNLALTARRADRLERLAADIRRERHVEVRVLPADLERPEAPAELEAGVAGLDLGLFVNNAGFGFQGRFLDQEPAALTRMIRLNCEAVALLARRILPRLAARGRGGMIVVASAAGYQPVPGMAAYAATKGFDLLLGEALASELRASGVDVLTLSPGHTETEFHAVAGVAGAVGGISARASDVVESALARLGRTDSFVHGWRNAALIQTERLTPRRLVTYVAGRMVRGRAARGGPGEAR